MMRVLAVPALVDRFGRVANDLRVSVTDKCNLRCTYCMPAEGLGWRPGSELLTGPELVRLIRLAVGLLGITSVRLTGGEPLIRPDLEDIVAGVADLGLDLALTTNGVGLAARAQGLRAAGLGRVNISLDTLDRARFATIARRDRLADVLAAIDAAQAAGLVPIKINAVILRGVNEDDVLPLARFCLARGLELRFIEEMPLGPAGHWDRRSIVTRAEILARLGEEFDLGDQLPGRGASPAALHRVGVGVGGGVVGVIPTVTEPFCGACDRTRLTADGYVLNCLFGTQQVNLRDAMRAGADDEELAALWRTAQWDKAAAHGIDNPGFVKPARTMSQIGG